MALLAVNIVIRDRDLGIVKERTLSRAPRDSVGQENL